LAVAHAIAADSVKVLTTNVTRHDRLTDQVKGFGFAVVLCAYADPFKDFVDFGACLPNQYTFAGLHSARAVLKTFRVFAQMQGICIHGHQAARHHDVAVKGTFSLRVIKM
jgi:hypothetical protein